MTGRSAYGRSKGLSWTRIDMLLHIYDRTIERMQEGISALDEGDLERVPTCRVQVQKGLLLIVDGLNVESSEAEQRILALCIFVMRQMATESQQEWQAACRILRTLRDGFREVAPAARDAEAQGIVPAIEW